MLYNVNMTNKVSKATFTIDNNQINVTMPFAKIDEEKRLVSGFATLDNIDKHNDVVTARASLEAFSTTQAKLREMHQPIAVGKIVNFEPREYYDAASGETHQGIYVTAYVSRGAQDAWEKVLDGTYSGFSIGGSISKKSYGQHPGSSKPVTYIDKYSLNELSLVDNPANQLANIFTIHKSVDGDTIDGIAVGVVVENVYYCQEDQIAFSSTESTETCKNCSEPMENIGWFEHVEEDATQKFATIVKAYQANLQNNNSDGNIITKQEGGNKMSEATNETTEEVTTEDVTEVKTEEEKAADPATDNGQVEDVEEAAEEEVVEEVENADFEKMFSDLKDAVTSALEKNQTATSEEIAGVKADVDGLKEGFEKSIEALKEAHAALTEKFGELENGVQKMETKIDAVEKGTAVKKSGDHGGSKDDEKLEKSGGSSIWNGTFFDVSAQ
jgi:hypothetical protein